MSALGRPEAAGDSAMRRIEDYALLGDLQTAALVHRDGSIDWCCLPRFDSAACFAALLGAPDHGRWRVAPSAPILRTERRYRPGTLILEALHETADGVVRVIDFMPPRGRAPDIVRIVEGVAGRVTVNSELVVRFDYGRIVPWVRRVDHLWTAIGGPDALCLRTPVALHGVDLTTVAAFDVTAGERLPFVLTWYPSHEPPPEPVDPELAFAETDAYWQEWSGHCELGGPYHEAVAHSLLVLKALTYAPTGGIVAAATTSLPEQPGGVRNWDYRYCWLRDAALTLMAMLAAGHRDEAADWGRWLLRAVAGDPAAVQIMYGIAGERRLPEQILPWLPGFADARPVRIGNAASTQLQLDVYGEVLDAVWHGVAAGVTLSDDTWSLVQQLLAWLEDGWNQPDAGIWEVRGPLRHFTHSKVMAWVAFDRALRIADATGRAGPVRRWRAARDAIRAQVLTRGWSPARESFVQAYDTEALDASLLLLPLVGFLPADDPRMVATVAAIRRELARDGLIHRYRTTGPTGDGLPPGEGAFVACSFWLVEVLALQERHVEAEALFTRLLTLRNDVGLLAEEYDPAVGQLGNLPQAFSHLALVTAAMALAKRASPRRAPATTGCAGAW
jgi:GH15 family glucan-1,4-alpha-glucosidase